MLGRPPKFPEKGTKRANLTLRVHDATREALAAAAATHGRSLSEEAETRLDFTVRAGTDAPQILDIAFGPELAGVLRLIGRVIADVGGSAKTHAVFSGQQPSSWLDSKFAVDQVTAAVADVFKSLRPAGSDAPPLRLGKLPSGLDLDMAMANLGSNVAVMVLRAVAGHTVSGDLDKWAPDIRARLGEAAVARIRENIGTPRVGIVVAQGGKR